MPMGAVGILIALVYVCFGVLIFAILCTGLVVLLRVNALLKRRAASSLDHGRQAPLQAQPSPARAQPSPEQAQPSPEQGQSHECMTENPHTIDAVDGFSIRRGITVD